MNDAWHTLDIQAALEKLGSRRGGLTGEEAAERLARHGPNELQAKKKTPALVVFLKQFMSPLIYILAAAAVVSMLVDHQVD
ncbi:MAG: cation-transporting P-type ATPase, partial [Spirochaetota bacterium]